MREVRVTLVSPFDPHPTSPTPAHGHVGGVERVLATMASQLAERGNAVTLLCSTDGPPGDTVEHGIRVVRVHRTGTLFRTPVVNLAKRVLADADIVHVAATYPFTTPSVLRRAGRLGIPSVLDFHFEPHPATYFGRLAASLYRLTGPSSYRLADAVLIRSNAYGQSARSLVDVPRDRWRVVPNGINTAHFRAVEAPSDSGYLLFVGRLVPYKGLNVLFRALVLRPIGLPLVVAGEGPLRGSLEALAKALRLDVRFLGHVPDEDLPGLYRGASVTILPSLNRQEAFGISLLESMACGTPVVASALPGVDEVARLGGLLATPGDAASLADQIHAAIGSNGLARGSTLSARIHRAYSWQVVTDRLVAVYDEVLGARRGSGAGVAAVADPIGDPVL